MRRDNVRSSVRFIWSAYRLDDNKAIDFPDKAQELFCYLIVYRDRPHARDMLPELIGLDIGTLNRKKYLRQVLWQL